MAVARWSLQEAKDKLEEPRRSTERSFAQHLLAMPKVDTDEQAEFERIRIDVRDVDL